MIFKRFRNKNKSKNAEQKSGQRKSSRRGGLGPSILTGEVVIDGHLLSGGELQIDGEINGNVRARAVVIDVNGIVHGEVSAEDVIVRGRIIGLIRGLHVHILNGGHVEGDILNESISIENGAFVDGKIHRVDDPLGETYGHGEEQPAPHYSARTPLQQLPYGFDADSSFNASPSRIPAKDETTE